MEHDLKYINIRTNISLSKTSHQFMLYITNNPRLLQRGQNQTVVTDSSGLYVFPSVTRLP